MRILLAWKKGLPALFLYQPHIVVAVGFYSSSPTASIFAHLKTVHCDHQLFPITEGFNIVDFVVNCVSIPK
jgi:hypothetical protein